MHTHVRTHGHAQRGLAGAGAGAAGSRRKGHRAVQISAGAVGASGSNGGGGGGGSKREAELVRLLGPPSGGGRPEGADHGVGEEESTTLV